MKFCTHLVLILFLHLSISCLLKKDSFKTIYNGSNQQSFKNYVMELVNSMILDYYIDVQSIVKSSKNIAILSYEYFKFIEPPKEDIIKSIPFSVNVLQKQIINQKKWLNPKILKLLNISKL